MPILIVVAVDREAEAIGRLDEALVVVGGIGRTNAAAATTEAIIRRGPFDAVLSAGLAGALPGGGLEVGETILASSCHYAEEGIVTAHGFSDIEGLGFALGDFTGNAVPVDADLLQRLGADLAMGPIATVATCSGTDAAAAEVVRRTGAVAEAMEGAAVVHAARRLHVPAIELRAISNRTGDRAAQHWDLAGGLAALGQSVRRAMERMRAAGGDR